MRVIVCGSRHWTDRGAVEARLAELPAYSVVVCGYNPEKRTPRGADEMAYKAASDLGFQVETHPADWDRYGKAAGAIRNQEMAVAGADLCIAFWDGRSPGTTDMMKQAEYHDIPVEQYYR